MIVSLWQPRSKLDTGVTQSMNCLSIILSNLKTLVSEVNEFLKYSYYTAENKYKFLGESSLHKHAYFDNSGNTNL